MFENKPTILSRLHKQSVFEFLARIIKNKYLKLIIFIITVIFISLFIKNNFNSVRSLMTSDIFKISDFLEISILLITALILGGFSWNMILLSLGIKPKWYVVWYNYYTSSLMRYVPGFIWSFLGKSYFVHEQGSSKNISITAVILEFFLQIFSGIAIIALLIPSDLLSISNSISTIIKGFGVLIVVVLLAFPLIIMRGNKKQQIILIQAKYFLIANLSLYLGWIILGIVFNRLSTILYCSLEISYTIWTNTLAHIAGIIVIPSINGIGVREFVLIKCVSTYCPEINTMLVSLIIRVMLLCCELFIFGIFSLLKYGFSKHNTK